MIPFSLESTPFKIGNISFRAMYGYPSSFSLTELDKLHVPSPNHAHSQYEIHYILSGVCRLLVGDDVHELKAGDFAVVGSNVNHAYLSPIEFDRAAFLFSFTEDFDAINRLMALEAGRVLKILKGITLIRGSDDAGILLGIINEIYDEFSRKELGYYTCVQALFSRLFISVCRRVDRSDERDLNPDAALDTYRLAIIDQYFIKHMSMKPNCDELAGMLGISIRQLNRTLVKAYGSSFREKLTDFRIKAAAAMLRNGDESVEEVADKVGYSCATSFIAGFKKKMGITPAVYKRRYSR